MDHCFPEFDIWTQFASSDFSEALNLDALKNSHPIEARVNYWHIHCNQNLDV